MTYSREKNAAPAPVVEFDPIIALVREYQGYALAVGELNDSQGNDELWTRKRRADLEFWRTPPTTMAGARAKIEALLECEVGCLSGLGEDELVTIFQNLLPRRVAGRTA